MHNDCIIRRMTIADLDAVAAIEAATFPTPWSKDSFRMELERNVAARYLVAEKAGEVIGYGGAWIILDESHITNIAIAESQRGHGYGRLLTETLMQYLANLGAAYATLEVRKSNIRAQNLYKSVGFIQLGVRKRYYEDNNEDALLMVCDHMPEVDPEFEEEETVRE
ncbi:MAG: ribosomal protein S18-alanine N-acetyltransferase [Clostridia bacterium]|nr:ribosomal protein S18-alanine N-acetyltransferase [Clostridia bacterium]